MVDEIVNKVVEHLFGTWRFQRDWISPLYITHGEGAYVYSKDGKKYLDFSSQLVCVNLGYGNRRIIDAVREQLETLPYLGPGYATDIRAEVIDELAKVLPPKLSKYVFSSSGSEANEDALKIARSYKFPSYKIIARYWSYHGNTPGAMSISGDPRRMAVEYHTNVRGTVFAPDPYCYRCPFGESDPEKCGLKCITYLEYILENEGNIAAIFMETVTGTNGIIVPPSEYFKRLRELADKYSVLLIFDEVMSGWGRTGKWFAFQHWGIAPDIMTTAKGATSSYIPIGLTAMDRDIGEFFRDHFLAIGHTFAYHTVSLAALKAAILEYREKKLIEKAAKLGEYLGKRLEELKEKHKSVGDIRGLGLFWAVEIVKNRRTKKRFNTRDDKLTGRPLMTGKIAAKMRDRGVLLTFVWLSHFVIAPPLVVTEEDIDLGVETLDEALKIADAEVEE